MDFCTLWTSKNEHFAWRVLQKSNFHVDCYRRRIRIGFGRILGLGWRQFWVPNGAEMRLRKEMLYSMDFRERAQAGLRSGQRVKNYLSG